MSHSQETAKDPAFPAIPHYLSRAHQAKEPIQPGRVSFSSKELPPALMCQKTGIIQAS